MRNQELFLTSLDGNHIKYKLVHVNNTYKLKLQTFKHPRFQLEGERETVSVRGFILFKFSLKIKNFSHVLVSKKRKGKKMSEIESDTKEAYG